MALSYYANWETFQLLDSGLPVCDPDLQAFQDAPNHDDFFDPFYQENSDPLLYDFCNGAPFDSFNSIAIEPYLLQQEFAALTYSKRPKGCDFEQIYFETDQVNPTFFNGSVPNPCLLQDYSPPDIAAPPLPDFPTGPPIFSFGSCGGMKKEASAGSLSAQSIAARQRRRRITEKTQELGKLVPGGPKMNTAEMLQAAYKYIKYLQAQVGVLEFIASHDQENAKASISESSEEFQLLLQSPLIQEKLYSTENCLVPQRFNGGVKKGH